MINYSYTEGQHSTQMRLNVTGDIIEVFDDHDKKAGGIVLSRQQACP